MKALTCPQCGSLIKNLLPYRSVAGCDYCGAKLITGEQFLTPEPFAVEATKFRPPERSVHPDEPGQAIFIVISGIGLFVLLLLVIAYSAN